MRKPMQSSGSVRPPTIALRLRACLASVLRSARAATICETTTLDGWHRYISVMPARSRSAKHCACLFFLLWCTAAAAALRESGAALRWTGGTVPRNPPSRTRDCTSFGIQCDCEKVCDHGRQWGSACDSDLVHIDTCRPGSVVISPWLRNAIDTQWQLQMDLPLNQMVMPSTHNSMISIAHGYGIQEHFLTKLLQLVDNHSYVRIGNQRITVQDQMNLGVMMLEIDVHYFDGALRINHCGGVHAQWLDKLIKFLSRELHETIHFDAETIGCMDKRSLFFTEALGFIRSALGEPAASDRFAILYIDDQEDLASWNQVNELVLQVNRVFSDMVFTPAEYDAAGGWPTVRELIDAGKRVAIASRTDYGEAMNGTLFYAHEARFDNWSEHSVDSLEPFPSCAFPATDGSSHACPSSSITRVVADSLAYGPFWNGSTSGVLTPSNISEFSQCGIQWLSADQYSQKLAEAQIWSWRQGEPQQRGEGVCVTVSPRDGRWAAISCNAAGSLPSACSSGSAFPRANWKLAPPGTPCSSLQSDMVYSFPRNGYENAKLLEVLRETGATSCIINVTVE